MANQTKQVLGAATTTVVSVAANMSANYVAGNTTLLDNSSEMYPYGLAVLYVSGFGTAPTANTAVSLWAVPQDIDSTNDATNGSTVDGTPAAESGLKSSGGAIPVGRFYLANSTSAQRIATVISLLGLAKANFFIKNESGVTLNAGAGTECTVKITPFTLGPA